MPASWQWIRQSLNGNADDFGRTGFTVEYDFQLPANWNLQRVIIDLADTAAPWSSGGPDPQYLNNGLFSASISVLRGSQAETPTWDRTVAGVATIWPINNITAGVTGWYGIWTQPIHGDFELRRTGSASGAGELGLRASIGYQPNTVYSDSASVVMMRHAWYGTLRYLASLP